MPISLFGITDNEQVNRDRIRYVQAYFPQLSEKEAIKIEQVDAILDNRSTEDFNSLPLAVVRMQLGFGIYGSDNDGIDGTGFLDMENPLLISEMVQITSPDAPTSTRAFVRFGYWPQFVVRENPYVGQSMTLGVKYVKSLNQVTKLFCRVKYSIVRVSDVESIIFLD